MYILTDGKRYIEEKTDKHGEYNKTETREDAKEFSYKQARTLLNSRSKRYSWIKKFHMVDSVSGKQPAMSQNYEGNAGAYIGENDIDFDENLLDKIMDESDSILGLAGWNMQQLKTYENLLTVALSKYDSAESDIEHALQKYTEDNDGKKPQAHKMAKVGYLLSEVRDKHKRIKQCLAYVKVMEDAITYKLTIDDIKMELSKARFTDYKGRTDYYRIALDILN